MMKRSVNGANCFNRVFYCLGRFRKQNRVLIGERDNNLGPSQAGPVRSGPGQSAADPWVHKGFFPLISTSLPPAVVVVGPVRSCEGSSKLCASISAGWDGSVFFSCCSSRPSGGHRRCPPPGLPHAPTTTARQR